MKYNLFEINERLQNGEITSEQAHKELLILFDVVKPSCDKCNGSGLIEETNEFITYLCGCKNS